MKKYIVANALLFILATSAIGSGYGDENLKSNMYKIAKITTSPSVVVVVKEDNNEERLPWNQETTKFITVLGEEISFKEMIKDPFKTAEIYVTSTDMVAYIIEVCH